MKTRAQHRAARRASVVGRPSRRLLTVLLVVLVTAGTSWFSGASFTSSSFTWATVGAAADYHPPTVAVTSPGATVSGTVTVQATASDSASGVASVRLEHAAAGSGSWTTLCTDTTAPYSCSWNTTLVADGDHRLRALATDVAGFSATSAEVTTRVSNPVAVVLTTVPDAIRGTVTLSATVSGHGTRTPSSAFQFRLAEETAWTTVSGCAAVTGSTPSCAWNTTGRNDLYDVRVLTTAGTATASDEQLDVSVDNTNPTISVNAPSPMSGTVQVTATAADEDSGIARVELSYRLQGATSWTVLCTVVDEPYRCALNTTTLTNLASYQLRGIATDEAGNTATSATITRQVNNGIASITITSPLSGDPVRGTRTITTDHATPLGTTASQVRIEARPVGGTYTTVCTDTTAPFTCDWSTTALATGSYELRATMTYGPALTATSPVVTVTVDNTALKALDVQASNGTTAGKAAAGDTLVLTYEGTVDLTTVKAGWTGAATSLSVLLTDKNVAPATSSDRAAFSVPLGTVTFAQNYVKNNKTVTIPATMTAAIGTVDGVPTTTITITFGSITSSDLRTASASGAMRWTPSATVRNNAGLACSTATAVESGANDRDL